MLTEFLMADGSADEREVDSLKRVAALLNVPLRFGDDGAAPES